MTKEEEVIFRQEFETEWNFLDLRRGKCLGYENQMVHLTWLKFVQFKRKNVRYLDPLFVAHKIITRVTKQSVRKEKLISELKEELRLERNFSAKFELQSIKGYPTPKEWSELSLENMKTQQQRRRN